MSPIAFVSQYLKDIHSPDPSLGQLQLGRENGRFTLIPHEDIVLSGIELFEATIRYFNSNVKINWQIPSGKLAFKEQVIATVSGFISPIMTASPFALNFLCHLTGLTTLAKCYTNLAGGGLMIQCDHKNFSAINSFENTSIELAGVQVIRQNPNDYFYFTEDHIKISTNFSQQYLQTKNNSGKPTYLEVRSLQTLESIKSLEPTLLVLKNLTIDDLKELAKSNDIRKYEVSGHYSLNQISELATLGYNCFNIRELKFAAPQADLSLILD